MKDECKECGTQVFAIARDRLCPKCRREKKRAAETTDAIEASSTNFGPDDFEPQFIRVVDRAVTVDPLAKVVKFTELPTVCLDCRKPFAATDRPVRQWQRKAKLLVLAGIVASLLWTGFLIGLCNVPRYIVIVKGPMVAVVGMVIGCIVAAPGIAVAFLAARFKKVVRLRCHHCGWKREFLIDAGR